MKDRNTGERLNKILNCMLYIIIGLVIGFVLFGPREIIERVTIDTVAIKEKRDITPPVEDLTRQNLLDKRAEKIIYVDAGHGFDLIEYGYSGEYGSTTEGAVGEAEYAALITEDVIKRLEEDGYTVMRIEDLWYNGKRGNRKSFGNSGRYNLFMHSDCDMMIQMHYDDAEDISLSGGHVIYGENSFGSRKLAEGIIHNWKLQGLRLNEQYVESDYVSRRQDLTVYSTVSDRPIILVECGFGAREESADYYYLRQRETKDKIAEAITQGVNEYFGLMEHTCD